MSLFAMTVGSLLHFHLLPYDHARSRAIRKPVAAEPVDVPGESFGSDDLEYFGLCKQVSHEDARAEIEDLALLSMNGESHGIHKVEDEMWLSML